MRHILFAYTIFHIFFKLLIYSYLPLLHWPILVHLKSRLHEIRSTPQVSPRSIKPIHIFIIGHLESVIVIFVFREFLNFRFIFIYSLNSSGLWVIRLGVINALYISIEGIQEWVIIKSLQLGVLTWGIIDFNHFWRTSHGVSTKFHIHWFYLHY